MTDHLLHASHRVTAPTFLFVLLYGCGAREHSADSGIEPSASHPSSGREFGAVHIPDGLPFPGGLGRDPDGDGYRWPSDCAPRDAEVNPDAEEVCDGVDNDCNGLTDSEEWSFIDGEGWLYEDSDGDGLGDGSTEGYGCEEDGLVTNDDDCDDTDSEVGEETTWHYDRDGDGVGGTDFTWTDCEAPSSRYVESGDDCDDTDDTIWPGAEEVCDGLDNDCDGALPTEEDDSDGDGSLACEDCDDDDAESSPDTEEALGDELDNDCDGVVDELEVSGGSYTLPAGSYDVPMLVVSDGGVLVVTGDTTITAESILIDSDSEISGVGAGDAGSCLCEDGSGSYDGGGGGGGCSDAAEGGAGGDGGWLGNGGAGGPTGATGSGCSGGGPWGGAGGMPGASLTLIADELSIFGAIYLDGSAGAVPRFDDGGGGGGPGGALNCEVEVLTLTTSAQISATGGVGADGGSYSSAGGGGGGGGPGGSATVTYSYATVDGMAATSADVEALVDVVGGGGGAGGDGSAKDGVAGTAGGDGTVEVH